jgi:hypothetical protein
MRPARWIEEDRARCGKSLLFSPFAKQQASEECRNEHKAFSGSKESQRLVGKKTKRRGRMIDDHHQ